MSLAVPLSGEEEEAAVFSHRTVHFDESKCVHTLLHHALSPAASQVPAPAIHSTSRPLHEIWHSPRAPAKAFTQPRATPRRRSGRRRPAAPHGPHLLSKGRCRPSAGWDCGPSATRSAGPFAMRSPAGCWGGGAGPGPAVGGGGGGAGGGGPAAGPARASRRGR